MPSVPGARPLGTSDGTAPAGAFGYETLCYRTADRLIATFATAAAAAWVWAGLDDPLRWGFALANVGVAALYLNVDGAIRRGGDSPGRHAWVRLAIAYVVMPFNYAQAGALIRAARPTAYVEIEAWLAKSDAILLDAGLSSWLRAIEYPVVTEMLQLAYATFYFLPLTLAIFLWKRRNTVAMAEAYLGYAAALLISYLGYVLVPARSPGFVFPDLGPPPGVWFAGPLWDLFRAVGQGHFDAFPSGHTAVSLVVAYYAWRNDRAAFAVLGPTAAALVLSTVYLGYHYVVDVTAGVVLAAAVILSIRVLRQNRWIHTT
jgi:membrane-associated phospholipid phosphatase